MTLPEAWQPWAGIIGILLLLLLLMAALKLLKWRYDIHPELSRKLLHILMGAVTLTFPWVFSHWWPVVVLAAAAMTLLLSIRLISFLQKGLGDVLGGVDRAGWGEVYFPISVCLLFVLSEHHPWGWLLYWISILVLTLADATAALIGIRYGIWHYQTLDGHKSVEGSLAFFLVAFFSVHIPLLLWSELGRAETLLLAVLLGLMGMWFEAVAWRGLDNLIVPLACYLLLQSYWQASVAQLQGLLLATGIVAGIVFVYRERTTLTGSGLPGAVLVGYLAWTLGGLAWFLPPLVLFIAYALPWSPEGANRLRAHNVDAVLCVASVPLAWLFLAKAMNMASAFLLPYTLAFAAHLALIVLAQLRRACPQWSLTATVAVCVAAGWGLIVLPQLTLGAAGFPGFPLVGGGQIPWTIAGVTLAVLAFLGIQPNLHDCPADWPRWIRQGSGAALASLVGLGKLLAG